MTGSRNQVSGNILRRMQKPGPLTRPRPERNLCLVMGRCLLPENSLLDFVPDEAHLRVGLDPDITRGVMLVREVDILPRADEHAETCHRLPALIETEQLLVVRDGIERQHHLEVAVYTFLFTHAVADLGDSRGCEESGRERRLVVRQDFPAECGRPPHTPLFARHPHVVVTEVSVECHQDLLL